MIKVLQVNLHRSRVADDLLAQIVQEKDIDVLMISEQYKNGNNWYTDKTNTAAIWVANKKKIHVEKHGADKGFVWVKCSRFTIISCYLTPNQTAQEYREIIERLEDKIADIDGNKIVAGDFNARAVEWGMPQTNSRGLQILDMAARQSLIILNTGNTSTFRRPGYAETIPDISLASESIAEYIYEWAVLEDYTGSDHQYITFKINSAEKRQTENIEENVKWNVAKLDATKLADSLRSNLEMTIQASQELEGRMRAEAVVEATMSAITQACEASMPRKRRRENRRPVYWWTEEIAELRRKCLHLRRVAQRSRNRPEAAVTSMEHITARKSLRAAIKMSKINRWKELCNDVNNDPWGLGYKIVMKKIRAPTSANEMPAEVMREIVDTLFPTHQISNNNSTIVVDEDIPAFTQKELEEAATSMKSRKAPGPDGIPAEAIKAAVSACPQMMLNMYNTCLTEGIFSQRWKMARLVLIDKGKGGELTASSYRPLCMLDTAGKLFEKLLKPRLGDAIRRAGDLSDRQFGFRQGRSTIDAIQVVVKKVEMAESGNHYSKKIVMFVTLDVKNAFNSAKWADMIDALKNNFNIPGYLLRMIKEYLSDRSLIYSTESGRRRKEITAGAAQGSILGPDLWNVLYDSLLRIEMLSNTSLSGFADDLGAIIVARTTEEAQIRLNQVMRRVSSWMHTHGLELAEAKTEIVLLTKKRIPTIIPMQMGSRIIQTKEATKYLGIMLDSKLNFWRQIKETTNKAAVITSQLSRLMANIGGPTPTKRRLIMATTQSILLYGAEIWADALNKDYCRKRLAAVQRRGALRVTCSYRTVSYSAVNVIGNVIPIDLLAQERKKIYTRAPETSRKQAAAEARKQSLEIWQERWTSDETGRWTARLIPQLQDWTDRKHGEVNFYITQFLSGHGYFRTYLHRMGKVNNPQCRICKTIEDTAYHTFFECEMTTVERNALVAAVGVVTPENIIRIMLDCEDKWNIVAVYIEAILRKKKRLKYLDDPEET